MPNYWVVDVERSVVHWFTDPQKGEYADSGSVKFGQPLAIPGGGRTITFD